MTTTATELLLYIENSGELYAKSAAYRKTLQRHFEKGRWDLAKAAKGYGWIVVEGAKAYCKEFASPSTPYHHIFPKKVREEVQMALAEHMQSELEIGNRW